MKALTALLAASAATLASPAFAAPAQIRPDQAAFRELYRELVEIDTTLSAGDCTRAAQAMGARLKAAGYADEDVRIVVSPDHPREGNLVAVLRGADPKAKAVLLLAHIDVVEARREDWDRDPFTLVEEGGYFYARGVADDKAMAAVFTDTLVRLRQEGFTPRRDIKLALTCGEESAGALNGVDYLLKNHRALIEAEFALNEGAGGRLDEQGRFVALEVQAGEKLYQDFALEAVNPGGHSSRPVKDNAIVHLSGALTRVGAHDFPVKLNEVTRGYFQKMAPLTGGEQGAAMAALAADPGDAAALAAVTRDPGWNATLRTTCVPTMASAGHAPNALPQRARANVNCRILPGEGVEATRQALVRVIDDPKVTVTPVPPVESGSPAPPLSPRVMKPIEAAAARLWPGVPIVPTQATGATDGRYLNNAGIPTYGVSGMFYEPDGSRAHGLNERILVRSLYDGRDFLHEIVKAYGAQK